MNVPTSQPAGVLAIDRGKSKTGVALIATDGWLLGTARGWPFLLRRVGAGAAVGGRAGRDRPGRLRGYRSDP
jgi:hypothetical protein